MTTFTYNQIIEYIDGTRDLNFEAARKWAAEHGTTFQEDESDREKTAGKLKRYFIIGSEPEVYNPAQEEKEQAVRNERNLRLTFSDWTQLPDAPLTTEQKAAYAEYRQALRDVPEQSGFPDTVIWPTEPTEETAVEAEPLVPDAEAVQSSV